MIYLEAYKFFKRKLVCVLLIGIFFLVAVPEIIAISRQIPDYYRANGRKVLIGL